MWTAPVDVQADVRTEPRSATALFMTGLTVTFGNPKLMMFYLALLPSIIDIQSLGSLSIAELLGTLAVVLVVTDSAWVIAASFARNFLRSPSAMRIANRTSACVMSVAAALIAVRD